MYAGCPKKTHDLVFLAITPLWKGLEIKVGGVLNLQEILYVIGTKIFQIDLLEAGKIGSKDGNLTLKILNKIEKSQSFFFFNGFPSPVSDGGF